jgi:hypothetical protein
MCLTVFIDWKYLQSWLVFSTQLMNCCPHGRRNYTCVLLTLYLPSTSPPHPKVNVQCIQTVCGNGGWGGGVLSCVVDHEFNTLFLTRLRTYKIKAQPQTKMTSKRRHLGIVVFKVPSSMHTHTLPHYYQCL